MVTHTLIVRNIFNLLNKQTFKSLPDQGLNLFKIQTSKYCYCSNNYVNFHKKNISIKLPPVYNISDEVKNLKMDILNGLKLYPLNDNLKFASSNNRDYIEILLHLYISTDLDLTNFRIDILNKDFWNSIRVEYTNYMIVQYGYLLPNEIIFRKEDKYTLVFLKIYWK